MTARLIWLVVCGFLPLIALYYAVGPVAFGDAQAVDFRFAYYPAAEAVAHGDDLYPAHGFVVRGEQGIIVDYVYPPPTAIATIPLTILEVGQAEVVFQVLLVLAFVATLAVLDVRDWRCYGLAFLWPPVTAAVGTGNVTILLGLAAALVWRFRDRPVVSGASVGLSVATKFLFWPLTIWLASTRRISAACWSVAIGLAVVVVSWAIVGFRGLTEYPELVRRLSDRQDEGSYTIYALGLDAGLSHGVAKVLWAALALALLAAIVVLARRGDDRRAFVLALTAAIAWSPVVWLHYFSLLLVIVAIVEPRLGPMWFIGLPLQLYVTTWVFNGSTVQTTAVLTAAALTVALALTRSPGERRCTRLSPPAVARS